MIKINKDAKNLAGPKTNYWKLNETLLENKEFKNKAIEIIERYWKQACILNKLGINEIQNKKHSYRHRVKNKQIN